MPISVQPFLQHPKKLDKSFSPSLGTRVFTGLIEGIGKVRAWANLATGRRLTLEVSLLAKDTRLGDSIAINGCCLTVVTIKDTELGFDLLSETEIRTNLGLLEVGSAVNLERALSASGRYGGHFVTGHIDATGIVRRWEQKGQDFEMRIGVNEADSAYLVSKGCIAVDGISLTVAEVLRDEFSVWIIPHTRTVTALSERQVGERVNLEFDLLAKYTEKILAVRFPKSWPA